MAKPVDMELKKAFVDLQAQMVESTKKIHEINTELSKLVSMLQGVVTTQRGLSSLPSDTKTYESRGRMFLHIDLDEFRSNLKIRASQIIARSTELANTKNYLEKSLKESEDNIREMVQQKKEQSEAKSN